MAKRVVKSSETGTKKMRPALNPESREQQLVSLAVDLAEKQLIEGTASSQVITHFLKLGTMQHKAEMERLKLENELVRAKTESLKSNQRIEELYENAVKAMQSYSGNGDPDD